MEVQVGLRRDGERDLQPPEVPGIHPRQKPTKVTNAQALKTTGYLKPFRELRNAVEAVKGSEPLVLVLAKALQVLSPQMSPSNNHHAPLYRHIWEGGQLCQERELLGNQNRRSRQPGIDEGQGITEPLVSHRSENCRTERGKLFWILCFLY